MPNHKNMYGTFYGNSSRSGNSTSSRGMQTRRSRNGGVSMGNGNLVPRRSGRNGMMNGGGKPNGNGLEKGRPRWFANLLDSLINGSCNCGDDSPGGHHYRCRLGRHPDCATACAACSGEMSGGNGTIQGIRRRR